MKISELVAELTGHQPDGPVMVSEIDAIVDSSADSRDARQERRDGGQSLARINGSLGPRRG
jgi:hypothetical protein